MKELYVTRTTKRNYMAILMSSIWTDDIEERDMELAKRQ